MGECVYYIMNDLILSRACSLRASRCSPTPERPQGWPHFLWIVPHFRHNHSQSEHLRLLRTAFPERTEIFPWNNVYSVWQSKPLFSDGFLMGNKLWITHCCLTHVVWRLAKCFLPISAFPRLTYGVFNSFQKDCIRSWTHMYAITRLESWAGNSELSLKPRVSELGTCRKENMSDVTDAVSVLTVNLFWLMIWNMWWYNFLYLQKNER